MAKTKKKTKKRFEEKEIKRGEKRKAILGKERRDTTVVQYIRERINIKQHIKYINIYRAVVLKLLL